MDHFDRHLELELARWLDPIVEAPRRRRRRVGMLKVVTGGLSAVPGDMTVLIEPVTVRLAIAAPIGVPV